MNNYPRKYEYIKTPAGNKLVSCINDNLLLFKYACYDELVRACYSEGQTIHYDKIWMIWYKKFDIKVMDIIEYGLYNKLITRDPKTLSYRFSEDIIQCAKRWKENIWKELEQEYHQGPPRPPRTSCEFCGDVSNKPHEFSCRLFGGMM